MALRLNLIVGAVAGALFAISGMSAVMAQDMPAKIDDKAKAAAAVKARVDYMAGLGASDKLLVGVMKGEMPVDAKAVAAAQSLQAAYKNILTHFAPGTGDDAVPGSRARAIVWTESAKFKELTSAVTPTLAASVAAAKAGDQKDFAEKYLATNSACSACHKVYRAPRQQ